ncbi:glycosyltransferase [Segnochrobactraceae bacterium EtOH-i3]
MVPSIIHLLDDATVGGVTRTLDNMLTSDGFARFGVHRLVPVKRGAFQLPAFSADIVVSHLSVCWANLPVLTALRGRFPDALLIHVEHSYSERFVALKVRDPERFAALMRSAYALFDRVVAVSEAQGAWLVRRGFVRPEALAVINPSVDLAAFRAVAERVPGPRLKLGAIGRFDEQKGFDILVDALRLVPDADVELHLYGDGAERADLERRAASDRRVIFHGFTSDVAGAMAASDVILMPSRWEPFGNVAMEAFAAGRALVCSRADGLAGHAAVSGLGVGDGSQFGWAEMIERLPTLDLGASVARGRLYATGAEERYAASWQALCASHQPRPLNDRRAA